MVGAIFCIRAFNDINRKSIARFALAVFMLQLSVIDGVSSQLTDNAIMYGERFKLLDAYEELGKKSALHLRVPNFRVVLPGLLYRSGTDQSQSELSPKALTELCVEGFTTAIYVYGPAFEKKPRVTPCVTKSGTTNSITYVQLSVTQYKESRSAALHIIWQTIRKGKGPVLVHCWNGRHASGFLSALALMEFCKMSPGSAQLYWRRTAGDSDSVNSYKWLKKSIGKFEPSEATLTPGDFASICHAF